MTTEYLRGEVLLLLDWVQQQGPRCSEADRIMATLRGEAQSCLVEDLSWVLERALPAAEAWCLDALAAQDAAAFRGRCRAATALYDFGISSGLLARRDADHQLAFTTIRRKGFAP